MSDDELIVKITNYLDKKAIKFLVDNNIMNSFLREFILDDLFKSIKIDSNKRNEAFKNFLINKNLKSKDDFENYKIKNGWNNNNIESIILKPLKIKSLAEKLFEDQAESRFLARRKDLDLIVYSIIRSKNKQLAFELFLRIESNEYSFSELAYEHSEGTEKITNGMIGPLYTSQVNPVLMNRLRTLKKKELLEPFKFEDWWVILKLENEIPSDFTNTIKQQMCIELLDDLLSKKIEANILTINDYLLRD